MPSVWFIPVNKSTEIPKNYECPVYRTAKRSGELLTTGQSTNFLINLCEYLFFNFLDLPFDFKKYNSDHWVKRGTAILCSLN